VGRQASALAYQRWLYQAPTELPKGELTFDPTAPAPSPLRLVTQAPWKRVRYGSVLGVTVGGALSDSPVGHFSADVTLPQLCSCLKKAAHDPRIEGVYLKITPLACGWGKLEELRRHISYLRQVRVVMRVRVRVWVGLGMIRVRVRDAGGASRRRQR
jgi:hypothetical protein